MVPPLFILGVPRSGTTLTYQIVTQWLQVGYFIDAMNLFSGCPNLILRLASPFLRQPRPVFSSRFGKTDYRFAPAESGTFWYRWFPVDDQSGHYTDPTAIQPDRYATLIANVQSMSMIVHKPMVFKSVYLDMSVGVLAQIMPEARFLFIRRDLLYNCQSMLLARQQQPDPTAWWSVRPPHYRQWLSQPLWKQAVNQVFATQAILERDLRAYAAGRYFEITYEQVCANPRQFATDLADWLAPIGYKTYPETQLPAAFPLSTTIRLDKELIRRMEAYLEALQRGERHP